VSDTAQEAGRALDWGCHRDEEGYAGGNVDFAVSGMLPDKGRTGVMGLMRGYFLS
jgi:hypothetical protein